MVMIAYDNSEDEPPRLEVPKVHKQPKAIFYALKYLGG